jgi:hypothetical protein
MYIVNRYSTIYGNEKTMFNISFSTLIEIIQNIEQKTEGLYSSIVYGTKKKIIYKIKPTLTFNQ